MTPSPAVQRAAARRLASVRLVLLGCGTRLGELDWTAIADLAPGDAELERRIVEACVADERRGALETPVEQDCSACARVHEMTDKCPLKLKVPA